MPIFYTDKTAVLYIHVPKTGGSSIEALFLASGYDHYFLHTRHSAMTRTLRCSPQHYHADLLEACFDLARFDLIFMTVRHPVARMLSEYKMRMPDGQDPDPWVHKMLDRVRDDPFLLDNHLRPQVAFHVPGAQVFRQEDRFDAEWAENMNRMLVHPLRFRPMTRLASKTRDLQLSADAVARIEAHYAADIAQFGYASLLPIQSSS